MCVCVLKIKPHSHTRVFLVGRQSSLHWLTLSGYNASQCSTTGGGKALLIASTTLQSGH